MSAILSNGTEKLKTEDKDVYCRYSFDAAIKESNGTFLSVAYAINVVLIVALNIALFIGLRNSKGTKKYTRNEKFVLLLTLIDSFVAVVDLPLQLVLVRKLNQIGCVSISAIRFWHVFLLLFSGSVVLLIAIEQFVAVFYNNHCCGADFKEIYLVACTVSCFVLSMAFGVWYAIMTVKSTQLFDQFVFFFCIATYTIVILVAVIVVNTSLLIKTRKKLRKCEIRVHRTMAIEKRLTKTIMLISATLVVSYVPSVIANYYTAFIALGNDLVNMQYAIMTLLWTLVLCELNSAFNPFIYIVRNRKILRMYTSLFRSIKHTRNNMKK